MANPYAYTIKDVTNDVISSKEIVPTLEGKNKKGIDYNGYRVDAIEVLIKAHAGIAVDDYFMIELGYDDLEGDALAQLKDIDEKEYVERQVIGPFKTEVTANYGFVDILDPAKEVIRFEFEHGFCLGKNFFINFLAHGLAATRDCVFILYGNPVGLGEQSFKANQTKREI